MKKKIGIIFACMLLIAATVSSVTGTQMSTTVSSLTDTEIVDENEGLPCELANTMGSRDKENLVSQSDNVGGLNGRGVPFYAYNAWDPSGVLLEGPVYFDPATPGTITQLAATTSTDFISGGTWTNDGKWYGCEHGLGAGQPLIWTIHPVTGEMTQVGSYDPDGNGLSFNGLAYDPTTGTMYGCDSRDLYTVNMSTGASTRVGSFSLSVPSYMIGIAFDDIGNLYGDETVTDSLYQINPSTGAASLIGPLGININGAQDIAYDIDTNTLYLSAHTLLGPITESALYTCNTSNGAATKIGTFQGNAQITGFAIPYGGTTDTTPPTTTHEFNPATPDGLNGWYVSDVTVTFTATDTESGVAWTKYSLNNGVTWTTHAGSWPFDVVVSDGEHQLLYYSEDNAGNVESVNGPFALKLDKTTPEKRFSSFPAVLGPLLLFVLNIGLIRDGCSGLDRVEFYLNDEFHHQIDLSSWPVGRWRFIYWIYYNPGIGDKCSGIVYDIAGNWEQMKPQIVQVPQFSNGIKTNTDNSIRDMQEVQIPENQMCVR